MMNPDIRKKKYNTLIFLKISFAIISWPILRSACQILYNLSSIWLGHSYLYKIWSKIAL